MRLRFDCYGRLLLDVERTPDATWRVLQVGADGKRRLRTDLAIPADLARDELARDELARWLDDLLHEHGGPGRSIRLISD